MVNITVATQASRNPYYIKRVVLEPVEVMNSWAEMLGSFVVHDSLGPEDGLIKRLHWLSMVNF
jgi:hypothetical protein